MRKKDWLHLKFGVLALLIILPAIPYCLDSTYHSIEIFKSESEPLYSNNELQLTWTSRWQSAPLNVVSDSKLIGDHVELNATFPESFNITSCVMTLENGFRINTTRQLVIPSDPGAQFVDRINHSEFDWVIISGIEKGLEVNITCNFTNGDSDFMVWNGAQEYSDFSYINNLVSMVTGSKPETDVITWDYENDTMYIGCLNYDRTPGNWTLLLKVGVHKVIMSDNNSVIYDTFTLERRNQSVTVRVSGFTASNETLTNEYVNVTLCNFFKPEVQVHYPIELEPNLYNFTWTSSDKNSDDINYFSIWLSRDGGVTYQVLARNLTQTYYVWDSSGFIGGDYCIIRIRAFSIDLVSGLGSVDDEANYWPGDYSDAFSQYFSIPTNVVVDPLANIMITPSADLTFIQGQTNMHITWYVSFDYDGFMSSSLFYDVLLNGSNIITLARIMDLNWEDNEISVNVSEFTQGFYNLTIIVYNPGSDGGVVTDSVLVTVNPPILDTVTSSTTDSGNLSTPELFQLILLHGISIGSAGIIVSVVFLIAKHLRKPNDG